MEGAFPDIFVAYLFLPCYHCAEPACAIVKRSADGVVDIDMQSCLGLDSCGRCRDACPYDAIQFDDEENPACQKCNFCEDRWQKGQKPVCVEGCPVRALDAGPMETLQANYGDFHEATVCFPLALRLIVTSRKIQRAFIAIK